MVRKKKQESGFKRWDVKDLKEQFMAMLGCESEPQLKNLFKKAKRTLNAGCGVVWSGYLFNYNPKTERHCIDISLSVELAYKKTKEIKNVIISQASIFQLPYPDGFFDIIYSDGVIHRTSNPKRAPHIHINKLASGGLIGIYVYNKNHF